MQCGHHGFSAANHYQFVEFSIVDHVVRTGHATIQSQQVLWSQQLLWQIKCVTTEFQQVLKHIEAFVCESQTTIILDVLPPRDHGFV